VKSYWWWIAGAFVCIGIFALALNDTIYLVTSPPSLGWHVPLRKFYSVLAFALVGIIGRLGSQALSIRNSPLTQVFVVAIFSGLIEIAQRIDGSPEDFDSNLFDIACGALGGVIASALPIRLPGIR
jgi:hypothetical protein